MRHTITFRRRLGVTVLDIVVVVGLLAVLLIWFLARLPDTNRVSKRVLCAANLRTIGQALVLYANNEKNGGFPRTFFDPDAPLDLEVTPAGNFGFNVGTSPIDSFDTKNKTVLPNSVGASFFLLLKTQEIGPEVFICPSTEANRRFATSRVSASCNFGGWRNNHLSDYETPDCSYSYAVPFPSKAAEKDGFVLTNTLSSDFALASDVNPGQSTYQSHIGNSTTVSPTDPQGPQPDGGGQYFGNSPNHKHQGQNVLYGDGHVEFQTTASVAPIETMVSRPSETISSPAREA